MTHAGRNLGRLSEPHRGAHLVGNGFRHVGGTFLDAGGDLLKQLGAELDRGLRERGKRLLGGLHGLVDIGMGAERDPGKRLFGGGVFDVQRPRLDRVDPLAIDIEFEIVLHIDPPVGYRAGPVVCPALAN